jgi:hypothetical protein
MRLTRQDPVSCPGHGSGDRLAGAGHPGWAVPAVEDQRGLGHGGEESKTMAVPSAELTWPVTAGTRLPSSAGTTG